MMLTFHVLFLVIKGIYMFLNVNTIITLLMKHCSLAYKMIVGKKLSMTFYDT